MGRGGAYLTHIVIHPGRTHAGFTAPPRYRCDDQWGGRGEENMGEGALEVVGGGCPEEQMKVLRSQIRGSGGSGGTDNPFLRSARLFLIPAKNLSERRQPLS